MKEKKCKLCLKALFDDFQTLADLEEPLHELLFKLKLDISKETPMCYVCMANLQVSLNFVSNYIYMRGSTKNDVKVDLEQFDNTNDADSVKCRAERKCYFCRNSADVEDLVALNESKEHMLLVDILQKCIPELTLLTTEELLSCQTCLYPLQSLLSMINCLDTDKMENEDLVESNDVQFTFEPTLEHDVECTNVNEIGEKSDEQLQGLVKEEIKVNDNEDLDVKIEEIEIKSEQSDYGNFPDTSSTATVDNGQPCSLQCKICPFIPTCKADLKKHCLIHETPNILTYKCEMCTFEAKVKNDLDQHILTHDPSEKILLKSHDLSDTEHPKKTVYTCDMCTYETKYKRNLNRHIITHKNPSEVPIYACETCTYETKHERYLKQHLLTHRDTSDVTVYKCEICSHKTKYKRGLVRHMKTHRDPSQISMYKCGKCSFETRLSKCLDRHLLAHKENSSDLTLQKCNVCKFETKLKKHLVRHMLTHMSPSEITMYKCEQCSYETKYKLNLGRHMLTHTKHKRYLIRDTPIL